jgi:hypothetical protein
MKKKFFAIVAIVLLCSCNKSIDQLIEKRIPAKSTDVGYTAYTIKTGAHYADQSSYKNIETSELSFAVRFDSSAIYTTKNSENQYDINKLYGFSDNNAQHHEYSARFGWSWTNNALHLYAYVYNAGQRTMTDLGTIAIGSEAKCSIKVTGTNYQFVLNDQSTNIERSSKTPTAKGYMLYPYFGGDEVAPHTITIRIKDL